VIPAGVQERAEQHAVEPGQVPRDDPARHVQRSGADALVDRLDDEEQRDQRAHGHERPAERGVEGVGTERAGGTGLLVRVAHTSSVTGAGHRPLPRDLGVVVGADADNRRVRVTTSPRSRGIRRLSTSRCFRSGTTPCRVSRTGPRCSRGPI
jgi:hypothetical protein